ncbi:MAG: alpha-glucosidase [Erysipelotrichaceae bacterium]|nr:alpha-glucosidase [Erysipelotrichaceae bacterium]
MLLETWKAAELTVGKGQNRFTMSRGSFRYRKRTYQKIRLTRTGIEETENGFTVLFKDNRNARYGLNVEQRDGRIFVSYVPSKSGRKWNRFWVTLPTEKDEHIYGCGETYSEFDLKGKRTRIWVAEHQNTLRISDKIIREKIVGKRPDFALPYHRYESYYVQPTYVSSRGYYLHADLHRYAEFDFRDPGRIILHTQEEPRFICEEKNSYEEISERLTDLLGRQRQLPDWVYDGAILAMQGGTETIEEKLNRALESGVKVCGIWSQDWCGCRRTGFGYQVMWNWQWDRELYPDLDEKIREWKKKGVHFLGYINPFLALEKDLYKEASEKGYCVKTRDGQDYLVKITTFPAAMVDFTNPEAYQWYKDIIRKNMIELGLSGWMADFGEYLPVDSVLYSGEDPAAIHNDWPAIWAKLNEEVIRECGRENEIFYFTRAGYTGTLKHSPMMWTGDQHVDWSMDDGLPSVIPATLSLAMSGFGVTHSDAGGYTTIMHIKRSKELLMRWVEMNAFSPLLRTHEGNQPVNNVQFDADEDTLTHMAWMSWLHYSLKEYLQKLIRENAERGIPVMRPVFYHYDEDWAYEEKTEYLLGRDMLVAPVYREGARKRTVRLPDDEWIHLFSGKEYGKGSHKIEAPISCPPVFVRKGTEMEQWYRSIQEELIR